MITVTAFKSVPDFAKGQVRDLRVRWALEEAGLPYKSRLLSSGDQDKSEYRALQPFGQVPVMQDDSFNLFESGAILLHIAAKAETLMPIDPSAQARATQWLIAALNSVEPALVNFFLADVVFAKEEWAKLRHAGAREFAKRRLKGLSDSLGDKAYLDGDRFTVGDLMMASVVRIPAHTDLVSSDPRLGPYLQRCTNRPAFKRALDAQLNDFMDRAA
jgi:glutathione S-transferase